MLSIDVLPVYKGDLNYIKLLILSSFTFVPLRSNTEECYTNPCWISYIVWIIYQGLVFNSQQYMPLFPTQTLQ